MGRTMTLYGSNVLVTLLHFKQVVSDLKRPVIKLVIID